MAISTVLAGVAILTEAAVVSVPLFLALAPLFSAERTDLSHLKPVKIRRLCCSKSMYT